MQLNISLTNVYLVGWVGQEVKIALDTICAYAKHFHKPRHDPSKRKHRVNPKHKSVVSGLGNFGYYLTFLQFYASMDGGFAVVRVYPFFSPSKVLMFH